MLGQYLILIFPRRYNQKSFQNSTTNHKIRATKQKALYICRERSQSATKRRQLSIQAKARATFQGDLYNAPALTERPRCGFLGLRCFYAIQFEKRPDASLERLRDASGADILVCGHTYIPYHRILPSGRLVINDESVGKPEDGDSRAGYITLDIKGGLFNVDFIRVNYDIEHAVGATETSDMPHEYAQMLREGAG